MLKYHTHSAYIMHGDQPLCRINEILVDANQDLAAFAKTCPGFVVKKLPYGDYVMFNSKGQLIVGEEKKQNDYKSSWFARRLQRQLRNVLFNSEIAFLGLRGAWSADDPYFTVDQRLDIMKWQALGGLVVLIPSEQRAALKALKDIRSTIQPGRHLYSVIAGSEAKSKTRSKADSPCAQALCDMIVGMGPVTANKVAAYYDYKIWMVLTDNDPSWKFSGMHSDHIKTLRRIVGIETL